MLAVVGLAQATGIEPFSHINKNAVAVLVLHKINQSCSPYFSRYFNLFCE